MNDGQRQTLQGWFPIIAIVCVVLLILAGGAVVAVRTAIPEANRAVSAAHLQMIGMAMSAYASAHGNMYPDHVGRMVPSYCSPKMFVHPGNPNKTPPTYSGEARSGPVYRFGDVIFLYDPTTEIVKLPPEHIIAVSVTDYDPEWRNAVRADGSVIRFHVKTFEMAGLAPDNAARKAAGLPEISLKDIEALEHPAATTP